MHKISYKDIPKFTRVGNYQVDVPLDGLLDALDRYLEKYGLEMNPDFQRGHVWTEAQQIAFVEFILCGGNTTPIYLNHPNWMNSMSKGDFVVVDGLQRLTALLRFLKNEIQVFGKYFFSDFDFIDGDLKININNLKTRKEVLKWYLEINSGGTPHTKEEIERIKSLLEIEHKKSRPT